MSEYVCIASDVKLGEGVTLSKFINLYGCEVGDNTKIGAFVELQKNAKIGELQTEQDWSIEPTLVRKGASIGSGVTVLANITIGENALIGAGSIVTRDVPANAIVAGYPARLLRSLSDDVRIVR